MSQLSDEEVKEELYGELDSRLGRVPLPETTALHYRAFTELIDDLIKRGWTFLRQPDESGKEFLVVETKGRNR